MGYVGAAKNDRLRSKLAQIWRVNLSISTVSDRVSPLLVWQKYDQARFARQLSRWRYHNSSVPNHEKHWRVI
jgi:hypothetical protein